MRCMASDATRPDVSTFQSSEIQPGTVIAVYMESYDEVPQLGRVVTSWETEVEVEWLAGCYLGRLNHQLFMCSIHISIGHGKRTVGRESLTWRETIPLSSLLFPVVLTEASRLKISTVAELKEAYSAIRQ